jgi:DNA-binding transcriptional ArsR family regulator
MGDELQPFDWSALVALLVHPLKVSIIEALRWLGEPLSANTLMRMFNAGNEGKEYSLGVVSYHLTELSKIGVVEKKYGKKVRGAVEKFYFFPSARPLD